MEGNRTYMGTEELYESVQIDAGDIQGMGLIWAWRDCKNRGEWNSIKTAIEELAKGLVERESKHVSDKAGKHDAKEKKSSERRSDHT